MEMENRINTVQELIEALETVKDKSKPIFVYTECGVDIQDDITEIVSIDYDLSDRVDINIKFG